MLKMVKNNINEKEVNEMPTKLIEVKQNTCYRCNYSWIPRKEEEESITCPKCRSPYWNRPKRAIIE